MEAEAIGILAGLLIICLSILIYFLPSMIGLGKNRSGAIFVLNLLTGWTAVGWVAAFIWASVEKYKRANIKTWVYLFTGIACAAALFGALVTLVFFLIGYEQGRAQFDYFLLIDAGIFLVLGLGIGWMKSRVCAVFMFLYHVGARLMLQLDGAETIVAVIFGIFYFLGIIGTVVYQRRKASDASGINRTPPGIEG